MNVTIKLNDQESLNFTDKEVNLITPEEIKPLNISSIFDIIGKINKSKEIKTKNFDHLISAMKVEPLLPVICRQLVAPLYKFTTKYIIKTEQGDKLAKYLDSQEIKYERNKSDFKLQIRAWKPEYNNYCNENNINLNKLEKQTEYNQPFDDYYDELKTKPTLTAALYFTSRLLYSLNDTTPEEQLQYCNFGIINSIYDNTPKGIEKKKDILKKWGLDPEALNSYMDIREMQVNTIKGLKTVYDTYSIGRIVNAAKKPNVGDHFITKDDLLKANGKIDQISKPIEQVTKIFNLSTDSYIYKSFATQWDKLLDFKWAAQTYDEAFPILGMKVVRTTMNQMINSPTNQADNYNTARKYLSFFFEMNKVCGKILLKDKTPDGRINVAGPYHQEVAKTFDLMKSFTLYDVQPLVKSLGYLITHKTILPPWFYERCMNTFKTYQGNGFTDLVHEIDAMENIFYYKNATNEQLLQEYGPILMANKEIKERIDYIKSTKIEKGNLFILSQATEFLQTETEDLEQKLERIATQYTPLVEVMKDRLVETPNMMMFIPSSTTEVSSESKQQHNCLMSHGYEGSINKNCILVFIRRKNAPSTSFVTMSLNRKDHYSDFLPSAKLSTVIEKRKNMSDFNLQEIKTNQIDGYGSNSCQIYGSRLSKEEHKELLELLSNFFEKNQIHPNNHDFQTLKETVKKEQKEKQK